MTRHDGADRKSVIARKIATIHLVGNQDFGAHRLGSGQAPNIRDRAGRKRLFFGRAAIRALERDLASIFRQASAVEQRAERHARPLRIADRSELPLCPLHLRDQKHPTVTRALERGDPRLAWHGSQFLVAQSKRMPDRSVDAQPISGAVQVRRWKMTADVEQLRRSEIGVDLIERSFEILWLLLPDDQACRRKWSSVVEVALIQSFHHCLPWMRASISGEYASSGSGSCGTAIIM